MERKRYNTRSKARPAGSQGPRAVLLYETEEEITGRKRLPRQTKETDARKKEVRRSKRQKNGRENFQERSPTEVTSEKEPGLAAAAVELSAVEKERRKEGEETPNKGRSNQGNESLAEEREGRRATDSIGRKKARRVPRASAGRRRSNMQMSLSRKLFNRVEYYVDEELKLLDVQEAVEDRVSCSASAPKDADVLEVVKDFVVDYIRSLLSYRMDCCDAYADAKDRTLTEPVTTLPQSNELLTFLKSNFKLPTKFPKTLRVSGRNEVMLSFRCFSKLKKTAHSYFPTLLANEELFKLPGFADPSSTMAAPPQESQLSFLWKTIRLPPANSTIDYAEYSKLDIDNFKGKLSAKEYRDFWDDYIRGVLTQRIQDTKKAGMRGLKDLKEQDLSNSWLRAQEQGYIAPGETPDDVPLLSFSRSSQGLSIYEDTHDPLYLMVDHVCVARLVLCQQDSILREFQAFCVVESIKHQEGETVWTFSVGSSVRTPGYQVWMQCYPMFRMTAERRRARVTSHLDKLQSCIRDVLLNPEAAPLIKGEETEEKSQEKNQVLEMVAGYYQEKLNASQGKVLEKALKSLSADQNDDGNGFILVQGPPGTGKSRTICALVAVLLAKLQEEKFRTQKILVCAPSNAAVDVLGKRLLEGIKTAALRSNDVVLKEVVPSMIRIGPGCTDAEVTKISLDEKLKSSCGTGSSQMRRQKEKELLNGSEIWLSTCMAIGSRRYSAVRPRFLAVIIDETSQAIELDCLLPLLPFPVESEGTGAKLCVLVGDTKQLPPYEDFKAGRKVIEKGLMGRLIDCFQHHSDNCVRLQTQYRMHPAISCFPTKEFYSSFLENDSSVFNPSVFDKPYHLDLRGRFGPLTWIDTSTLADNAETLGWSRSRYNRSELTILKHLVLSLVRLHGDLVRKRIVVVSPYAEQLKLLDDSSRMEPEMKGALINNSTVDSIQGDEADIIILTTVRSNAMKNVGFLVDYKRMNVGLTRARYSLIIVGNSETLESDPVWRRLVSHCKKHSSPNVHFISPSVSLTPEKSIITEQFCREYFPESQGLRGVSWEKNNSQEQKAV